MSSPFRVFRKHQKVMMVVLVGLSMLSFVVCGSIQSAQDVSGPLLVALLALAVGSITWLFGLSRQKSTEYGAYGLLVGACAGLILAWNFSAPPAIRMKGGNISSEQLQTLQSRRILANTFVQTIVGRINESNPEAQLEPFIFGNSDVQSLAFGETLRREADRLGIVGSQESVTNFLKAITTPRTGGGTLMTSQIMQSVCREIDTSEQAVYDAIQDEWRMLQVQRMLSGGDVIPPETFWDAHQKLNVQQDMELAVLPAAEFVDATLEPSERDLEDFFNEYRENFPNQDSEGRPEPGRPGFYQPRRAQFAYVEGTADDYLDQVTVTPEEVDAEYLRRYPPPVDDTGTSFPGGEDSLPSGPLLPDPFLNSPSLPPSTTPEPPSGDQPMSTDTTEETTPEGTASPAPETDAAGDEATTPDATDEAAPVDDATQPAPDATEEASESSTESSCDDPAPVDDATTESTEAEASDPATTTEEPAEETPAAETTPAEETPAEETTTTETPAATTDGAATDAEETEAPVEPAPFTLSESEDPPPPAMPVTSGEPADIGPPPLTDELRAEIADYLRLIKADALLQEDLNSFAIAFEKQIRRRAVLPPESEDHLSSADALEAARVLATEEDGDGDSETFNFYFAQSPLLSSRELRDSEEHTFGAALQTLSTGTGQRMDIVMFQGMGDLHRPVLSESPTQPRGFGQAPPPPESRFVVWKIADLPDYAPENLEDDRDGLETKIYDQVLEAWRLYQARDAVEARAEELVALASASTEPFSTIFAETKLTGDDGLSVNTTETGYMSWYRQSSTPTNFMQSTPPVLSSIPGLPDVATGDTFMHTVFREMQVGDTKAVWNADYTHLLIVRLKGRIPATPEEWDGSREAFLTGLPEAFNLGQLAQRFPQFGISPPPVLQLAQGEVIQHMVNGVDLFEKYEVEFAEDLSQ